MSSSSNNNLPPDRNPHLYKILGLPHGSPIADVKKAFRELALKHHPDKNVVLSPTAHTAAADGGVGSGGGVDAAAASAVDTFKRVTEAYQYLSNPDNKTKYDERYQPFKGGGGGGFESGSGGSAHPRSTSRHVFGTRRYEQATGWCNNTAGSPNTNTSFGGSSNTRRFPSRGPSTTQRSHSAGGGSNSAATGSTRYTPEQEAYYKQRDKERDRELARKVYEQRRKEQQEELDRLQREEESRYGTASSNAKPTTAPEVRVQMPGASSFGLAGKQRSTAPTPRPASAHRVRRSSDVFSTSSPPAASIPIPTSSSYPPSPFTQQPPPPMGEQTTALSPQTPSTPTSLSSSSALLSDNTSIITEEAAKRGVLNQFAFNSKAILLMNLEENWMRIVATQSEKIEREQLDQQSCNALQFLRGGQTERALLIDYADMVFTKFQRLEQQRWELLLLSAHQEPLARIHLTSTSLVSFNAMLGACERQAVLLHTHESTRKTIANAYTAEMRFMHVECLFSVGRADIISSEMSEREGWLHKEWRDGCARAWELMSDREGRMKAANVALLMDNGRLKKENAALHRDLAQSAVSYGDEIKGLKDEILELRRRLVLQGGDTSEVHNRGSPTAVSKSQRQTGRSCSSTSNHHQDGADGVVVKPSGVTSGSVKTLPSSSSSLGVNVGGGLRSRSPGASSATLPQTPRWRETRPSSTALSKNI